MEDAGTHNLGAMRSTAGDCQGIEVVRPDAPYGHVRQALFDFDGTISLIRQGWQEVMIPLMVRVLLQTPRHEPEPELRRVVEDFVDRTTGVQTIYQMIGLADMVRERGGEPLEPLEYKRQYLDLLWERIKDRVEGLKSGRIPPEDLTVPGAADLLRALRERRVTCYLASGTDVEYVCDEVSALGLADLFDGGIYGAVDDWQSYSKAMIIQRILADHGLQGHELAVFGDGYVEIEEGTAAGGIAIGVASDEEHPGRLNLWKRERLIRVGAHIIIPDFGAYRCLVALLVGQR